MSPLFKTLPLRLLPLFASLLTSTTAQAPPPPAATQLTSFNSSFTLTAQQISSAQLSDEQAANIETVTRFDRSQVAFGGPAEDDFYTLPPLAGNDSAQLKAGVILKTQLVTDPTAYSIPPNTALSRILYTTKTFNGTVVPASAFVLWPYQPKKFSNCPDEGKAAPVVLWTHGTSGFFAVSAPSVHRGLWYEHKSVFTLALQGYAVVAPDYAGLGVSESWDGSDIPHQYLLSPAGAQDALHSLEAAWDAFPDILTTEYVVMGHSQGGGVAWAVSELLESNSDDYSEGISSGYRGTVSVAPTTKVFSGEPGFVEFLVSLALDKVFPDFKPSDFLTPLGVARLNLFRDIQGSVAVLGQLLADGGILKSQDVAQTSWQARAYNALGSTGRKPFRGPLLVMQGTNDVYVSHDIVEAMVDDTCETQDVRDGLEFITLPEVRHTPALDATRPLWLEWIEDRFRGREVQTAGCVKRTLESFLPIDRYQAIGSSLLLWANKPEWLHETPLGL